MARTGRRPGPSVTRAAILASARRGFAQAGYDHTSIRSVAADAGVDPAVVMHFFASKDGLFQAAVGWPFDPELAAARLGEPSAESIGAHVAGIFFSFWEDRETRASLTAILRSAMSHAASTALLREFVVRRMFARLVDIVDAPEADLRVELAAAHLIGIAVMRYLLRIEPLASATADELVAWVAPALTRYLRSD